MTPTRKSVFPFTAVAAQVSLKTCLVLAAIDPLIGDLLAMGDRGTGKSTTVRAFAALLSAIKAMKTCPYHCDVGAPQLACDTCRSSERLKSEIIAVPRGHHQTRQLA